MRNLLSLFLFASLTLTGCAALLIQPDDSTATTAAKVAARVPLFVVTFATSEMTYTCARGTDPPAGWVAPPESPTSRWDGVTPQMRMDGCLNALGEDSGGGSTFHPGWGPHNSTFSEWMKDQRHHQKGHDHHHPR